MEKRKLIKTSFREIRDGIIVGAVIWSIFLTIVILATPQAIAERTLFFLPFEIATILLIMLFVFVFLYSYVWRLAVSFNKIYKSKLEIQANK